MPFSTLTQWSSLLAAIVIPVSINVAKEKIPKILESIAAEEAYKSFKDFFQKNCTENNLRTIYIRSIDAALKNPNLIIDDQTRKKLADSRLLFQDFSKFIATYDQLSNYPFEARREKSIEIFRDYIQRKIPTTPDDALKIIEDGFANEAFNELLKYARENQKEFSSEIIKAFERMDARLITIEKGTQKYRENIESLVHVAQSIQKLTPDIDEIKEYTRKFENYLHEIKTDVKEVKTDVKEVKTDVKEVKTDVKEVKTNLNGIQTCIQNNFEILNENISQFRNQKDDDENLLENLKNYVTKMIIILNETDWPYDIDEKTFINIIRIAKGNLFEISSDDFLQKTDSFGDCDCISHIENQIFKGPTICVGYYGMGKSTISKMFFKEWCMKNDIYPIFLNLSHANLHDYCREGLENRVLEEVRMTLSPEKKNQIKKKNTDYITKLINSQKLLLILDGIDESVCDKNTIINFITNLSNETALCFMTCRLEFTQFFDAVNSIQKTDRRIFNNLNGMVLLDWRKPQWDEYAKGLQKKHPDKEEAIKKFIENVVNGIYEYLPARPLFFKMLSDLIIDNQTKYQISLKLQSNLSEIYYNFICWKILDDLNRKRSSIDIDFGIFEKEGFVLLKALSIIQYEIFLGGQTSGIKLTTIKDICRKKEFIVIVDDVIIEILLNSSLFSIIRRKSNENQFIFSHKSFMEYLVAHNIAEGLLTKEGTNKKPMCNKHWTLFQTQEVSDHLMAEIERIRVTNELTVVERNNMLLEAFQSALEEVNDPFQHDDRIEEILYYIGKFDLIKESDNKSRKLLIYLKKLIEDRERCPEKYYRTVSITLSRVVNRNYCEKYVLELLDDYYVNGKKFELNREIQLQYYGETNLRRKLKQDLDTYIAQDPKSCIISLKILTYFTSIPQTQSEKKLDLEYLQKISDAATVMQHKNIKEICDRIAITFL